MGHSYVGRRLGYKLNIITLMPYGAMLSGSNAPFDEKDEIKIAIAGPAVNLLIIIFFTILFKIFTPLYQYLYLFLLANIYTFCFNILPVYPLDGGRIFLAIMCKFKGRTISYKITKIVGFVITGIIFLLFFISFVYKLNYMLGINALFMLIGLLENDTETYYQKLNNFEKFKFSVGKTIKLNESSTIFEAYKKIADNKAKSVFIETNGKRKKFSKDYITSKILEVELNTLLKDLWNAIKVNIKFKLLTNIKI